MFGFLKDKIKSAVTAIKNTLIKQKEEEVKEEIQEIETKIEEGEVQEERKESLIEKIKRKLTTFTLSEADFERVFWELEKALLENNVAVSTIEKIHKDLQKQLVGKSIKRGELEQEIRKTLRKTLEEILLEPFDLIERIKKESKGTEPYVIVFFGINGSGKTTTIAKVAHMLQKHKISCILAAGDTFRAASIEQLSEHADKIGIEIVKNKYGSDPAAVAFDAIAHAKARNIKAVLIDTAGRMHSNVNLMEEMRKICKVAKPNMRIFIGEAITGNDAVEQAKEFDQKAGIDAIILTKADVDERGGASISIGQVTGKPILYLGMGQKYDDLEPFKKERIIKSVGL